MSGSLAVVSPPADDPSPLSSFAYVDPDILELEEARAAVAAEEAANAAAVPRPAPAEASQPPITVPHARFNAALERARMAEEAAAYWQGRAAAQADAAAAQPAAPPQAPAVVPAGPSPSEVAQQIEEAWMAAATEWDTGSITGVEFEQRKLPLLARTLKLHQTALVDWMRGEIAAAVAAVRPALGIVDTQVMAAHVERLNAAHPWATVLSDPELSALTRMAVEEATALRRPFPEGPAGTMALQTRVAQMASVFGPAWHPEHTPPTAAPAPAAPQPAARLPARSAGTRPNRADVETALAREASSPPMTPARSGANAGPIDLTRIETMTDAEIEALPKADRRRLLGI